MLPARWSLGHSDSSLLQGRVSISKTVRLQVSRLFPKQICSKLCPFSEKMAPRNPEREAQVRILAELARKHGVECPPARQFLNAARQKVTQLMDSLSAANLSGRDRQAFAKAKETYLASFQHSAPRDGGGVDVQVAADEASAAEPLGKTWKFHAVQLTYNNSSAEEWRSTDEQVLQCLFERFHSFVESVGARLQAIGLSTTMERGKSAEHVHCHAYLHFSKAFHRRGQDALEIFKFEGVAPHLAPNSATGKSYQGAVKYGHFYVVVQKIGSLFLGQTE